MIPTNDLTDEDMMQFWNSISHIVSLKVTRNLGQVQGATLKELIKDPNSPLITNICKTLEGSVVYEVLIKKIVDSKLDKQRKYFDRQTNVTRIIILTCTIVIIAVYLMTK